MPKVTWDIGNETEATWDEGTAPCFKLWPTEGDLLALIDADMFPYIVGFSQNERVWHRLLIKASLRKLKAGSKKWMKYLFKHKLAQDAINQCDGMVNAWTLGAGADAAKLYLTAGEKQFRYDVAFSRKYKGNRAKKPKPPFHPLIKWHLAKHHNAIVCVKDEADDQMSLAQWSSNQKICVESGVKQGDKRLRKFTKTVIVTKDKDLLMIPGLHSNPDVKKGKTHWVTMFGKLLPRYNDEDHATAPNRMKALKGEGIVFFYAQVLMGDDVDEYNGLPRCGMVKAYEVLKDLSTEKECLRVVKQMYKEKYGKRSFLFTDYNGKERKVTWKDMLCEQARLAWMKRKEGFIWGADL